MSSKRWDLCVAHKSKDGKWRSTKVGVIFEGDKGQLNIKVDPGVALSTPEGVTLTGWVPKERDGESRGGGRPQSQSNGGDYGPGASADDDLPF